MLPRKAIGVVVVAAALGVGAAFALDDAPGASAPQSGAAAEDRWDDPESAGAGAPSDAAVRGSRGAGSRDAGAGASTGHAAGRREGAARTKRGRASSLPDEGAAEGPRRSSRGRPVAQGGAAPAGEPDVMPGEVSDATEPPPPEPMIWHPSSFAGVYGALRESVPYLKECYRGWHLADPELQGRIVTRFRVVQDPADPERGWMTEAVIEEGGLSNVLMEGCVLNALSDLQFGAPEEREITVRYAMYFDDEYEQRVDRYTDVAPASSGGSGQGGGEVVP